MNLNISSIFLVLAGMVVLVWPGRVLAGDILRGGATAGAGRRAAEARGTAGEAAAEAARAKSADRLARTTQVLQAMREMQAAARAAGGGQVAPEGLGPGGLERQAGGVWTGAGLPAQSGGQVTISQSKQQAFLGWKTFNVGPGTTVYFDQKAGGADAGKWIAYNKIADPSGQPSRILGSIKAEGQVYLINQNGIVFGAGSQVNARTFVASTLPINDTLVERGLLNQEAKGIQFLFSTTPQGTFTPPPPLTANRKNGDLVVQRGAVISSPESGDGNGGRVMLVGANVWNSGTISTPSGQAILAAGLQVGIDAHSASDPSLRGLDVSVGAVGTYAGTVVNDGLVEASRGSISMTGRSLSQLGVISSTTSVSLNGRVDLRANYNAIPNPAYDPAKPSTGSPFLNRSTGSIRLAPGSVTAILPETDSSEKTIGQALALRSQVNFQGRTISWDPGSTVIAPNGQATVQAGEWGLSGPPTSPTVRFLNSLGQVEFGEGSLLDVSGTTGSSAPVSQNILKVEMRGAEFSDAPLQRKGVLRGMTLEVDIRKSGTYGDSRWVGTPLGDVSGYANLVERTVGQLTAAGGSVDISSGGSVLIRKGATIDVSGGWVRFEGGKVRTTRLLEKGRIVDIADATPDRIYDGIYDGTLTSTHPKWGQSRTFRIPLAPTGESYQPSYVQGADAGSLAISAPAMVLEGDLLGTTIAGPRQVRAGRASSAMPRLSSLTLSFRAQQNKAPAFLTVFPSPPDIVFTRETPVAPSANRLVLSPDLVSEKNFGSLAINNEDGTFRVQDPVVLAPGGSLSVVASNILVGANVSAPGGSLAFKALNISPHAAALIAASPTPKSPPPSLGRGLFSLEKGAALSVAGMLSDDRPTSPSAYSTPILRNGGSLSITAFSVDLAKGTSLDVSGGASLASDGKIQYGDGGSLSVKSGQDPDITGVTGGTLSLGADLRGYGGSRGGSLTVQAEVVRIGPGASDPRTLVLPPEFFRSGGFSDFSVIGLGRSSGAESVPGLTVLPGTTIEPLTVSRRLIPYARGHGGPAWENLVKPAGLRAPASISLAAAGVKDSFTGTLAARGDLVLGEDAVIRTDPGGTISLKGNTVAVLGSLYTPGGSIAVAGGTDSTSLKFGNDAEALVTVAIGPRSVISAAGTVVYKPDPFGRRLGSVLPGGTITISGNIYAAAGAVLDVSGTSGMLDLPPSEASVNAPGKVPATSGLTALPSSRQTVPTRLDSNGGTISLEGAQMLYSEATLLGKAGGPSAEGGTLKISSGRFYAPGAAGSPLDGTLFVTQSSLPAIGTLPGSSSMIGSALRAPTGEPLVGRGYFQADSFARGGFDSLALKGIVEFSGPVDIVARRMLSVADGGVLIADSDVRLTAPHVALGTAFQPPVRTEDRTSPFSSGGSGFTFPPTFGTGRLTVTAKLIDIGFLSFQNIGEATLAAQGGDIRGDGTLHIAGRITLSAAQIYPVTASDFSIIAYDYVQGGTKKPGTISVVRSGSRPLPLSAGGSLGIYASVINQGGVLVAPFGSIALGWDGTGAVPKDLIAGSSAPFPVTTSITLAAGSWTSVSGIDPISQLPLLVPYGVNTDGNSWIDPQGVDVTAGGLVAKSIRLSGANIRTEAGSVLDIRGGGDLYAYRWVKGQGGTKDLLASDRRFAIIPGYDAEFAPYAPFNSSTAATNLISGPGYANGALAVGDRVYLAGSASLPAGYYTLLPARYALLPGAVLVSPQAGARAGIVETPGGASLVPGFRYNAFSSPGAVAQRVTRFEVLSSSAMRKRAKYEDYFANSFLTKRAGELNIALQRLPMDSGVASIKADGSMVLAGRVLAQPATGGRGAKLDLSSKKDFFITSTGASGGAGRITLDAAVLNAFGVESLLVGGLRSETQGGTSVEVATGNIVLDTPGEGLALPEIILVAKRGITLAPGSAISSTGGLTGPGEHLLVKGDGTLLRVSGDPMATVARSGVTPATGPMLSVGAGASVRAAGITLDSSSGTMLSPSARLAADAYYLNSGRISLALDQPGALQPTNGLVLSRSAIQNFSSASLLSLLSYSSLDIYGTGTVGSPGLSRLVLSAGEIRGFNQADGEARFEAGDILIENRAGTAGPGAAGLGTGTLAFQARTIRLGVNQVAVDQFPALAFLASESFSAERVGGLAAGGSLLISSPVITAAAGSSHAITSAGAMRLLPAGDLSGPARPGGLGGALSFAGLSLDVATRIVLPSGLLDLRATGGDVNVSGLLDVSGTQRVFYDVTKFTEAGEISISSDKGNILLAATSLLNVSAAPGGGDAGTLSLSAPGGIFDLHGRILGNAGAGGTGGSFDLDVLALPSLSAIAPALSAAGLTRSLSFRVRSGDVAVGGTVRASTFKLSADLGSITVSGRIDATGATGGSVSLAARQGLVLEAGSIMNAAGRGFRSSGKGGDVLLDAGSVEIRSGAKINLSVAAMVAGGEGKAGSSASQGKFGGTLHIRAPQTVSGTDLEVAPISGTITGASSILVEGYRLYDLSATGGAITGAVQGAIFQDAEAFLGPAGSSASNAISARLLANNPGLDPLLVLAPGAEIVNRTGDLTLGTASSTQSSDWDLSTFRFGAKSAPGVLTMRAAGNLVFYNALSDGFQSASYNAALLDQNPLLPANAQSWSYRLAAGADLGAADVSAVLPTGSLGAQAGFLKLGKNNGNNISNSNGSTNAPGNNAQTGLAVANRFQVIRTGSGGIEIAAGRSVQLLNQFASIYTAGTKVADATMGGAFDVPILNQSGGSVTLGAVQQDPSYPAQYAMAGGNVRLVAGQNIERLTLSGGKPVADSQRQLPNNWLSRRGFIDPATGQPGQGGFGDVASTSWWVDYSNFFQGVGALGGGSVQLKAGGDVSNMEAVAPTNARMPKGISSAGRLVEIGGGDVTVVAGRNLDAGIYYVERGTGRLSAGGQITTNPTRSPSLTHLGGANILDPATWLPTTLFLGKGGFDVRARGDVLLGPVANTFLLPGGINNTFWNKTYFSTYAPSSFVNASSLGGDLTLRAAATLPSNQAGAAVPLLQAWLERQMLLKSTAASYYQPWLRLNENSVQPFATVSALRPPTLRATAFSGDIRLVGGITLAPSPAGTLDLLAAKGVQGLNPNGAVNIAGSRKTAWGPSQIILSDADPSAMPSASNPFAYQSLVGTVLSQARQTRADMLPFIDRQFRESGATLGVEVTLQNKSVRHSSPPLHAEDRTPLRIYAGDGDISGVTLFSPKSAQVIAARDLSDISLYLQNLRPGDTSVVAAGRDILPFNANSVLRALANSVGNVPNSSGGPLAGDIQISGPGTLEVLAGRNLDLGTGATNADGTGAGITSVGNARNPYLAFEGASLIAAAGIGPSAGLSMSRLDFGTFLKEAAAEKYLAEIGAADLSPTPGEVSAQLALRLFFLILRDAGRDYVRDPSTAYTKGFAAIRTLFPSDGRGEIFTRSRDIRTKSGGDIAILAPGGGITLSNTETVATLAPPGIITESGGSISLFAKGSVDIGIGRIFTLRGGDQIIWSSTGDIATGTSSKTVQTAPPTRVLLDPQSADLQTDLAGLATGGGIGVLATVKGVAPGDVDLIAPAGVVDAGDAGIRATGNLNIAATAVLNAGNIAAGGSTSGVPSAPVVAAPNIGGLSSGSSSSAAASSAAQSVANQAQRKQEAEEPASLVTVEVLGYGGGEGDDTATD